MGRWSSAYSFRSADFRGDRPAPEPEGRPCGRGDYCAAPVLVPAGDGFTRAPRPGPRAFCEADRALILEKLDALPEGHRRLGDEMETLRRSGSMLRMPYGPSLPLHEGMDALRREMAVTLAGWHARVAAAARLSGPPSGATVLDDGHRAVTAAVRILCAETHVDTLLGLQAGWMRYCVHAWTRQEPEIPRDPIARPAHRKPALDWLPGRRGAAPGRQAAPLTDEIVDAYADCEIITTGPGYLIVMTRRDGSAAGLDVFSLHRRCELLLGEVRQNAETLDGVPCRREDCEEMALERAEPPSDPARPAMYSRCAVCGDTMSLDEYRAWAKWYAKWADGTELTCLRCLRNLHGECEYDRCACPACGKIAA